MWGGDGFESLEEQKKLYGKSVTDKQPSGSWRAGQPTVPGVDCSGLVFQLQKAMRFEYGRLTAEGYRKQTTVIIPETKDPQVIVKEALPGDLIFFLDKGKAVHVAWHVGNGYILESVGTRDHVHDIPKESLELWAQYTNPKLHKKTDHDYGGMQLTDLKLKQPTLGLSVGRFKEMIPKKEQAKKSSAMRKK